MKSLAGENAEEEEPGKAQPNGKENVNESAAFYQQGVEIPENEYPQLEQVKGPSLPE